ncbi:hypothetical protein HYDPIDRAFT_28291 [Hydnomerulius pinastri MD-312]|uniref:Uncharacterized protein n=1 Tax=Hydnomerulius pinastri MD-312 TaxID=994086 RepID=A0A0C9WG77_9AGAM|nr:hypothetical protein HYDPIDRAFT_28291 [Hydnomerulius pinastri MD-312]
MSHSFVLAKFSPERSATWTSFYGSQRAAYLTTRPFAALRIPPVDIGSNIQCRGVLFAVSTAKPSGTYYVTLEPASGDSEGIKSPHLVSDPHSAQNIPGTLYIQTIPPLYEPYSRPPDSSNFHYLYGSESHSLEPQPRPLGQGESQPQCDRYSEPPSHTSLDLQPCDLGSHLQSEPEYVLHGPDSESIPPYDRNPFPLPDSDPDEHLALLAPSQQMIHETLASLHPEEVS